MICRLLGSKLAIDVYSTVFSITHILSSPISNLQMVDIDSNIQTPIDTNGTHTHTHTTVWAG